MQMFWNKVKYEKESFFHISPLHSPFLIPNRLKGSQF